MLGKAFVRGLEGDHPKYLKAAACAKHFAVHSGPEPSRHADNFNPSGHDLWNTYLPAFKELVVNAKVAGVMCAYNAVDGQPCCANDVLMNDILRKRWGFAGYVTSDCWALDDFFRYHKTHPDAASAAVDALIHGTDVECGNSVYVKLLDAVRGGRLKEAQLDASVRRLFIIRFRLGLFDPAAVVPFAQTGDNALEAPEHTAHSLKVARQSIVLLKNEGNALPLKKSVKKIAVIGPNADNPISVLGNYNGIPSRIVTVLDGIREKLGSGVEVVYEKAVNFTNDTLLAYTDVSATYSTNGKSGVKAEYFSNEKLEGVPAVTQTEADIDHYWTEGVPPVQGMSAMHYSARYTTTLIAAQTETLNFEIEGDDGYRLLVNDSVRVDAWNRNRWGARQLQLPVVKGQRYKIVVEFWQSEGPATIRLKAGNYVKTDFAAWAARLKDADAVVFAGGISPQLEGEEMQVNAPGFNGGDRTSILLPAVQTELLKALKATGKPVVFVMMTGSAIAVPWEAENVPAILNAWYGGQAAGTAVADVLFGDYNPAGRLPVTFYRSDSDLPGFKDYGMAGRTYRYFSGQPLYGFGYGLSYTTFKYDGLVLPASLSKNKNVVVTVKVSNTGKTDGEEVVQLYVSGKAAKGQAPIRSLKGFQRIFLKAGETKTARFNLTAEDVSVMDDEGNPKLFTGRALVSVGGRQPDATTAREKTTVQGYLRLQ